VATPGEPFSEAAAEAVQTSMMAVRLVVAIADAVRRQEQKREKGEEEPLPPEGVAMLEAAPEVTRQLPPDISAALLGGEDWPLMAQQLVALRKAGVDMTGLLAGIGEIAATVREQVMLRAAVRPEGEGREWERVLREAVPAGPVREAILSSPRWPEITDMLARLKERGVDVRRLLAAAAGEGSGVERALAGTVTTGVAALRAYGPLTVGLDIPKNLDLNDRGRALRQLAITPQENERYARYVREAMPGHERDAEVLISARQWPLLAARMAQMEESGMPVREHLTRLMRDTSWQDGPASQLGARLVQAANVALRRPVGDVPTRARVPVSTAAAKATSTGAGPTRAPARSAATAEPGVAAHRQAGPTRGSGRSR
jgi:hypothetical protein